MRKAVGYTRISAQNYGSEAQLQAIQESLGPETTLVDTFSDQANGSGSSRPGLQDLLEYLEQRQVDALVIYNGDRLTRSIDELSALLEQLKSRGISVRTIADSLDIA
jgi:DNA invertase Pin-like site-specific DNA recombinase